MGTATGSLAGKDLASGASVVASSAQPQHPASNAVDGNGNSFWASASDPSEKAPVDLTISLGGNSHVALIEIDWELPPKSFEVQTSAGGAYSVLESTQVNSLNTTVVVAGGVSATSVRLRMREPHPVWGAAGGDFAYGVRAVRVIGSSAAVVVHDCAEAAASEDARDKFFMVAVPELDASLASSAQASAALAMKAGDRLSGLLARLVAALPTLESCAFRKAVAPGRLQQLSPLRLHVGRSVAERGNAASQRSPATEMDRYLGVDEDALALIIGRTRAMASVVRSSL